MPLTDAASSAARVQVLAPQSAPAEGLSTVRLDLAAMIEAMERVGRDEALLLVTVKALRQRHGHTTLFLHDLAWVLRTRTRRVHRWLQRLTRARHLVYDVQAVGERTTVTIELIEPTEVTPYALHYDVPTHWFVQTLPIVGRTAFAAFLYALAREPHGAVLQLDHLVRSVRLRGRFHGRFILWRLRAHGLLARDGASGAFVVTDPPLPSARARKRLVLLASPVRRHAVGEIASLVALLALVIAAVLALLAHIT